MDGLTLLRQARAAGLAVRVKGETLVIHGPRRAERVARLLIDRKPEVMAALAKGAAIEPWRAVDWLAHFARCAERWGRLEHSEAQAARLAWSELQCRWHRLYGGRVPAQLCAGCGKPIGGAGALSLPDGTRVHFANLDCLARYGERWRAAATKALSGMGLTPPPQDGTE
ncbi:MAG: hypothetical protein ACHQRJ_04305 [Alphaproteobacteria bacterium]